MILIPIIDHWPGGRSAGVTILGFAQMYLQGYSESDGKRLDAIFLDDTFAHPEIRLGPINNYGTKVIKITN